jgi:two-component system, NarL family, response regulator
MNTTEQIRVLIADDHPIVRMGVAFLVSEHPQFQLVAEASSGEEAVRLYGEHRPDVVLMDLRMPGLDGVAAIAALRELDRDARIVILTIFDGEEDVYRGLRAGAKAYLLKDSPRQDICDCIIAVARGQKYLPPQVAAKLAERLNSNELSKRELEVLRHLARGLGNKEIARVTGITEGTVKFHVTSILSKLDCSSRTEAVTVAVRRGLIGLS